MISVRAVVEKLHAKRKELNLPIRQPLAGATVSGEIASFAKELSDVIEEETNIKHVTFVSSTRENENVVIDTTMTPELIEEGKMRELIRKIQGLRKDRKCSVTDEITVQLPELYKSLSEETMNHIMKETLIKDILWGETLDITISGPASH